MNTPAIRHILVAHDFCGPAVAAQQEALRLAEAMKARVTLMHVYTLPAYGFQGMAAEEEVECALRGAAEAGLDACVARARRSGLQVDAILRRGTPWIEVGRAAAEIGADLVVVGTHGRTGLKHLMLGSVAEKLVRTAPCPVLVVRGPADGPAAEPSLSVVL
jgi:nucleotide-binding universal stress UspA family protein